MEKLKPQIDLNNEITSIVHIPRSTQDNAIKLEESSDSFEKFLKNRDFYITVTKLVFKILNINWTKLGFESDNSDSALSKYNKISTDPNELEDFVSSMITKVRWIISFVATQDELRNLSHLVKDSSDKKITEVVSKLKATHPDTSTTYVDSNEYQKQLKILKSLRRGGEAKFEPKEVIYEVLDQIAKGNQEVFNSFAEEDKIYNYLYIILKREIPTLVRINKNPEVSAELSQQIGKKKLIKCDNGIRLKILENKIITTELNEKVTAAETSFSSLKSKSARLIENVEVYQRLLCWTISYPDESEPVYPHNYLDSIKKNLLRIAADLKLLSQNQYDYVIDGTLIVTIKEIEKNLLEKLTNVEQNYPTYKVIHNQIPEYNAIQKKILNYIKGKKASFTNVNLRSARVYAIDFLAEVDWQELIYNDIEFKKQLSKQSEETIKEYTKNLIAIFDMKNEAVAKYLIILKSHNLEANDQLSKVTTELERLRNLLKKSTSLETSETHRPKNALIPSKSSQYSFKTTQSFSRLLDIFPDEFKDLLNPGSITNFLKSKSALENIGFDIRDFYQDLKNKLNN